MAPQDQEGWLLGHLPAIPSKQGSEKLNTAQYQTLPFWGEWRRTTANVLKSYFWLCT